MATRTLTRKDIGKRIQAGRILRGWSQEDMARELGQATGDDSWTYMMVSKLETGYKKIEAEVLAVIAELHGQEISWYYETPNTYTPAASSHIPRYHKSGRPPTVISLDDARAEKQRRERTPVRQAA